MPRKRQRMVKVSTKEEILGNIQSSSKRDIWCSQTKTVIFQPLQNSCHQNQDLYGVKTKDFFISICGKLCDDCCLEKDSKTHKKPKRKKRKIVTEENSSANQNMADNNVENFEDNSPKKKRKIMADKKAAKKLDDKIAIGNVSEPKLPKKVDEIPMIIPDKDKHIPLQILRNLDGKICKYCKFMII